MNNGLKINYEETISAGEQITAKGDEFEQLLGKIKTINSELAQSWEGSDATKYTNAVAEQAQTMQQLANTINEIGAFLVKVGKAYKEVSEQNASSIR